MVTSNIGNWILMMIFQFISN